MNNHRYKYFNLLLLLIVFSCTENLLWDDEEPGVMITGTVLLDGVDSPENVFIWFKEFDLVVRPDGQGRFTLPLPSLDSPTSGQSISGKIPIYFYVNNYTVDSVMVEFINGQLVSPQPELNDEYELNETIELEKLLNVSLSVNVVDTERVEYRTKISSLVDHVSIKAYGRIDGNELVEFSGFLLVDQSTGIPIFSDIPNHSVVRYIVRSDRSWFTPIVYDEGVLSGDNDYLALPFFVVVQEGIDHIRNRVGLEKETYTANYIHLPFSREGGAVEF